MEADMNIQEGNVTLEEVFNDLKRRSLVLRSEPIENRKVRLKRLLNWIYANRQRIKQAVFQDFRKPEVETDISETYPVIGEIKHALSSLDQWSRPKKVDATISYLGTRAEVRYEPKGVCLIISPWNYPFNLSICPLVSCLAAGNTALLKPSEATPYTSRLIAEMVEEVFQGEVVVIEGNKDTAAALVSLPFDHIFFTGSSAVGKLIMKAAAANLTSVTLELGGKSPTIVHQSARIKETARRIAFGKFLNNGQTCIAPDYLLVHEEVKEELMKELKTQIEKLFGGGGEINDQSASYGRLVNKNHFGRLKELMEDALKKGAKVVMSGESKEDINFFPPVILTDLSQNARMMEEEIFGPILPVISFKNVEEVVLFVNSKPKPLALYVFGNDRKFRETILTQTSAGSVCINDCVLQFTHPNLPFGGVNNSGIGKSHGHYGFLAFSNEKPVLRQKRGFALAYLFHPPFSKNMKMLLEPILRWF